MEHTNSVGGANGVLISVLSIGDHVQPIRSIAVALIMTFDMMQNISISITHSPINVLLSDRLMFMASVYTITQTRHYLSMSGMNQWRGKEQMKLRHVSDAPHCQVC
jgi:hypothetical protein